MEDKIIEKKLNYLYELSNIPPKKRIIKTLFIDDDGTDEKEFTTLANIEKNIKTFVNNGDNLFLYSSHCGNGKTSWAFRLINSYFNAIVDITGFTCRGLFINVPQFLLALKDNISNKSEYIQNIKENVLNADLVIWDDIGTKSLTPFEAEHLLAMIDVRLNYEKSNIYTSNLNEEEMHKFLGDRLTSRIVGSNYRIELHGKDKRYHDSISEN